MENKWVILVPMRGTVGVHRVFGPFDEYEQAEQFAESHKGDPATWQINAILDKELISKYG